MRYRIIIEIDTPSTVKRPWVDLLAKRLMDETITSNSNPVFMSTEIAAEEPQRTTYRDD